jgi:uncharacterized damage-inducible protein DinB
MSAKGSAFADRLARLRRLFEYDEWANREALASLAKAARPPEKGVKALAHVLGAERLWLDRLLRAPQGGAVWPEATVERMRKEIDDLSRRWDDYLDDLAPSDFESKVEYVNSKGETWSSTVGDILNHVLLHSSYHRGQVASEVRGAGAEPAYTDFIHAVRAGFVE